MILTADMTPETEEVELGPNSLLQELFLSSDVDEVGGFGKKGWGKTWACNHMVVPWVEYPDFSSVVFRRTSTDFADMWAKAMLHYAPLGPKVNDQKHSFTFPSGARRIFRHLQHLKDVFAHNGQEYQEVVFDELPQFPMFPYLFMISCLRSVNPAVPKRLRATGNFFGEGVYWVKARFYDKLRPTRVVNGEIIRGDIGWFRMENDRDTRAPADIERVLFELCQDPNWREIKAKDPLLEPWMSREWYFGERSDNVHLMKADPGYEARLWQLPERMRRAFMDGLPAEESDPKQLFMAEWVDKALGGSNKAVMGVHAFGLDYSEGGDNTILVKGRGNQPYEMIDLPYTPHYDMAEQVRDFVLEHGLYQVLGGIDTVGTGAGVYSNLQKIHSEVAQRVNPIRHHDEHLKKAYEQNAPSILFKMIQYQILWKLRVDLQRGAIDLSVLAARYHNVTELREELLAFRIEDRDNGIWISSTDDLKKATWPDGTPSLGRSPDRVKALAIWNYVRDWNPAKPTDPKQTDADYEFSSQNEPKSTESPWI